MQASYDQLRAARVLLDISVPELCERAQVSKRTVCRIEAREKVGLEMSMRVQKALEAMGVEFLPETEDAGPGLRVPKGSVKKIGFQIYD